MAQALTNRRKIKQTSRRGNERTNVFQVDDSIYTDRTGVHNRAYTCTHIARVISIWGRQVWIGSSLVVCTLDIVYPHSTPPQVFQSEKINRNDQRKPKLKHGKYE